MTLFLLGLAAVAAVYLKGRYDGAEAARATMRASLEKRGK